MEIAGVMSALTVHQSPASQPRGGLEGDMKKSMDSRALQRCTNSDLQSYSVPGGGQGGAQKFATSVTPEYQHNIYPFGARNSESRTGKIVVKAHQLNA